MKGMTQPGGGWFARGGGFLLEDGSPEQVLTPEVAWASVAPIAGVAREFVEREVIPAFPTGEHDPSVARRLLQRAGELGLLGVEVEERYGGLGLGPVADCAVTEAIGRGGDFAVTYGAHSGIGTLPLVLFGTEEQKGRYLPQLAAGSRVAAYALTEPMAGSDALSCRTVAQAADGGFRLSGQKQWITNAGFADLFVVYAKVGGEQFTAFLVERGSPGLSLGPEEDKLGIRGSSTRAVYLDQVFVPAANVLGEVGRGHVVAFNTLNVGRFKLACGTVGSSVAAMEVAARYAEERRQFGRPIADFGLVQEKLATMAVRIYALESMVYRVAGLLQALRQVEKDPARAVGELAAECSMVKVYGSEALDFVVDEALQIHGGYGFMNAYPVSRMYRDARINRIFEGTNEINRLLTIDALLRRAFRGQLPLLPALQEARAGGGSGGVGGLAAARRAVLYALSLALERFETRLEQEQEIVGRLADMAMALFAAQSAFWRARRARAAIPGYETGEATGEAAIHGRLAALVVEESLQELVRAGREAVAACCRDGRPSARQAMAPFTALQAAAGIDTIALRREVAGWVREARGYPVKRMAETA